VPSIVSINDISAANNVGRQRIAYHGSPAAPALPAGTITATSVAVSKPRPNSTPVGYMCPARETRRVKRPSTRLINPRCAGRRSSSASSNSPRPAANVDPRDFDRPD